MWMKNRGKWDRLQGRELRSELGHPAVLSIQQIQIDRELREARDISRDREIERLKRMEEAELNRSRERRNIYEDLNWEPHIQRTHEMTRAPPRPSPVWEEPTIRFERRGMTGGPSRNIHPSFPKPRPTQIDHDNMSGDDNDEDQGSTSKDND